MLKASGSTATETMNAVREASEAVVARYNRNYFLGCIEEDRLPTELLAALADSGLTGIGLSEELGGSGGGLSEELVLFETAAAAGFCLSWVIIANFCRTVIERHGTPEQISTFIPRTLDGRHLTCFAFTEADSGTNSFGMRTRAKSTGEGWRINGQKIFISGAGEAHQMLMVARTGEEPNGRAELSMFVLDLPHPHVSMTRMRTTAFLPEHQYVVSFDDVDLPPTALVGEVGGGAKNMFLALNPERLQSAINAIGLGQHVLNKGVAYARDRAPFGTPIGAYQAVQHPLAKAHVELHAARTVTYAAARAWDDGDSSGFGPNAAKFLAGQSACDAFDAVMQVFGGSAYDRDNDLLAFYEPIRTSRTNPINNESILNFVAERVLDLPRSK